MAEIVLDGVPGCCLCYTRFAGEIESAVRQSQGCTTHTGKDIHGKGIVPRPALCRKVDESQAPRWIGGDGPEADIVISTRARLARSLSSYPFPLRASGEDLSMVVREVRTACAGLAGDFPGLRAVSVSKLDSLQKSFLLDAHVASVEQLAAGEGRAVVLEPSATLSVMVNEEDHVRLQVVLSGLAPEEAWELADWVDDVLSTKLSYGFSTRYGYLAASVSNVGTGLRVSVMMHLAGMAAMRRLGGQLRAAHDLGVSVRGMFGEGSRSVGDLFQVSNEVTLGLSEREIVERVRSVASYILKEERGAREDLLVSEADRVLSQAARSLDALRGAASVKAEEAIALMSPIRLAAALGLTQGCSRTALNEILVGMRVGEPADGRAGEERADLIRAKLAETHIMSA